MKRLTSILIFIFILFAGKVEAQCSINLSSASGTDAQTVCINSAITDITYATTGATGANVSGLPAGLTGDWAADIVTISGIPTESGSFNYTVLLTGGGCDGMTTTGSITVTAINTVSAGSSTPTLCINTLMTSFTHTTTGATGIGTPTDLPSGVTAAFGSNTITISGTPTESGVFNYIIPLTGGCGSGINATGTITVTANMTAGAASSTPTLCVNTLMTNITHTTTGATGIGTPTNLPAGVTAAWASNTITISGTPTASGVFNYIIPITGGCGSGINATGTITVTANMTAGAASSTPTLCINTLMTNITHTTTGATGIGTPANLPAGVTAAWASNTITISGTPTASGVFNYIIPITGGCGSGINATGTITVTANMTAGAASSTPTLCINSLMTNITHTTTGATGIGTPTNLPAGVTAAWASNTITISGTPTASGVFNYIIPLTGGCGTGINATGTITVTANMTAGAASSTPTLCINTLMTNITHTTTGATGIGTPANLPAGVTAAWATNTITISGTPTASGVFNYIIPLTGGCGTGINATGIITVTADMTAGAASSSPTLCINTLMTNITHTTTGATGIGTPANLPAGVTAAWATNTITISGTPTASGVFNYIIPLTGGCGSGINASGTITVTANMTVGAASSTPTLCINTLMTNITHTTTGATGIGTPTNLPAGVTATWATNTITISGTPAASGVFNYIIPLTGGCGSGINATGTITVTANMTAGAASSTPTLCINTLMTNITHTTTGATGIGTPTNLPAGVTAAWATNTITISGTPTASGVFNYIIPLTGGCGTGINATGTITVTANMTAGAASLTPTLCINTLMTNITHTTTGATGIGTPTNLPAGVTAAWATNTITINGTPTASGVFNYIIPLTGGCGSGINATGTITVTANMTAGAASSAPTLCINTLMTNITHTTTGVTGIGTPTNLPAGVTAAWATNTITISGTPTASGVFNYIIPLTGGCGSGINATGTITVTANMTAGAASSTPTLCVNTLMTNITHTTTGATGIGTPTNLPAGVTAAWATNTITISGTPTASGVFNYIIPLTGGCGTGINATGTITVTANMTAGAASLTPTLCINTLMTNITHTTTGATGIGTPTNLPAGVTAAWATNTITISGTPTASGVFNYIIPLTGGCGSGINATGTITVTANMTAGAASSTPTLCINTLMTNITHTTTSATGIGAPTNLPSGVTAAFGSNTITISGTPTGSGVFNYSIPLTGGCGSVNATGTITVMSNNTITLTSAPGTNNQTVCINTAITNITYSTTVGTGVTFSGLPTGVTGTWAGNLITISGTPSVSADSPYNYIITLTGGCETATASGTITIIPNNTITLTSEASTNSQTVCINTAIANIAYSTTGATGATFSGLPAGVSGTWAGDIVTISGSPNVSAGSPYNYTVTLTGGCGTITTTGTIVVNPLPIPTLSSTDADHVICKGTSVTFTAGGGTTYAFQVGSTTVQSGTSPTYTTTSLINGQTVDVIVTNSSGCAATSSGMQFFVNSPPFIFIYTSPSCSADLTTYSFSVVVSNGTVISTEGVVTNTSGNIWTITGVPAAVNVIVTVTDSGGCQNTLTVTAPNCACPVISAPVSGGDKSYCASGTIPTLSATVSSGLTVDWYTASLGGTLLKSGSITYTPTAAGVYYAEARNTTTSCISSTRTAVTATMISLPIPLLVSSDADNVFCAGTSVTFTAGGGSIYNFRVNSNSVQNGTSTTYTTSSLTNGQIVDVIVTSSEGCADTSSTITNTVNTLPTPTLISSDADNTFCAGTSVTFTAGGGVSYNFKIDGTSIQNATVDTFSTGSLTNGQVLSVVVTNAAGCTASPPGISNTVNPVPVPTLTSSDTDNIFCAGSTVIFTAGGGTNYNFMVGGISVQNSHSDTYTTNALTNGQQINVIVTNSVGCAVTSASITNTIILQPVANPGTGGNACDLNYILNAVPSIGTGTWTKTSGPGTATFSPDANTADVTVSVSDYGTYSFTWTETNGICSSDSTISVNFYLQPVAKAGKGGNNCGLQFYLDGTMNAGEGTWSKVRGPGDATFSPDDKTANALVTVTDFGNYTFKWSVVNGKCADSDTTTVDFIEQPPANAGSGGSECDKDFVFSAESTIGTGTWEKTSGPGNATYTPDNHHPDATVTVDQFGSYEFTWTIVNSTCTSSDKINVVFHEPPSIDAGKDTIICNGGSVNFHALGTGSFAWTPTNLLSDSTIMDPVATPVTTTTFKVTLTDQYGCVNSDEVTIEVRDKSVANAGADQVLDYLFETTMNADLGQAYETGSWSVISGNGEFTDTTNAKTAVKNLSLAENKFLWTVTNGYCPPAYDTVSIFVNDFVIPTLITPNMDGRNDYFVLKGLATLGKTELIIFNRRGAEVYKNLNYDNSWNGVDYNSNPLADDTYFFVLKAENGISRSGFVVIRH